MAVLNGKMRKKNKVIGYRSMLASRIVKLILLGMPCVMVGLEFLRQAIAERVREKLMVQRSQPITIL